MRRRPLLAAALSALIPGAGQLYARDPYRAVLVFSPAVLVATGLYAFSTRGAFGMAELLVQPEFLTGLLVANAAVLVWRVGASVDAYILTSRGRTRTPWAVVGLVVILTLLAAPQAVVWAYGAQTISALNTVFLAGSESNGGSGPATDSPLYPGFSGGVPDPTPYVPPRVIPEVEPQSVRNLILRGDLGDPAAIAARGDIFSPSTPEAPFAPLTEQVDPDRLTILLVGGDAGPGREGLRTDSMNVVTVDLNTGAVGMFGLPRNLKLVPLPRSMRTAFVDYEKNVIEVDLTDADLDGYPDAWVDEDGDGIPDEPAFVSCECFPEMLNKVHQKTQDWTRTYPDEVDPGLAALRDIVGNLLDIHIDYYFMVEMAGFVRTIDALGGVDVYVEEPYHVMVSSPEEGRPKAKVNVEPGMNHLSGLEALAYSRWRIGSSDYDRMGRQRCVIKAAATQADPTTLIRAFPRLLDVMEDYVTTDIPVSFLPELVRIAGTIDFGNVATVGLTPPRYSSGRTPGHYPIPNVSRMRAKVQDILDNGVTSEAGTVAANECNPPAEDEA